MTDNEWTADRMPDMSDRTVVVTGANSGLGFEASKAFARAGADVVMACRSTTRGEQAAEDVRTAVPDASLDVRELDLADLASVAAFAEEFEAAYDSLHVLCNNAGVMAIPYQETVDGFEKQFGVNHLGHFALTAHLLATLRGTDGETRVVTQSSGLHERGEPPAGADVALTADNAMHYHSNYDAWDAYAWSKLANLLFAFELDRRLSAADSDVTSVGCHPGYAATNLQFRGPQQAGLRLRLVAMKLMNAVVAQDAERGALPMCYAATAEAVTGGDYVGPGGFMGMRGYPAQATPSERARDGTLASRLWEVSLELTGVSYGLQTDAAPLG